MKKSVILVLACLLAVCLCACGGEENKETTPSTQPSQSESQASSAAKDLKALAESCIDKSVEELYQLVGMPKKADYADSCLNPGVGEDGILEYDGFMVYTYREGDEEVVSYVE